MLFEFRGKLYEINNILLIFFIIIVALGVFLLLFSFGKVIYSGASKIDMDFIRGDGVHGTSGQDVVDSGLADKELPKEFKELIIKDKPIGEDQLKEVCLFGGKGRIAPERDGNYMCRKTENLKTITFSNMEVGCCVTP